MPRAGSTTERGYDARHKARVAELFDQLVDGTPCVRCGRPRYRRAEWNFDGRKLQGDHVGTPRALGDTLPDALTHARCNAGHGARLGNALRRGRPVDPGSGQHRDPATDRPPLPEW